MDLNIELHKSLHLENPDMSAALDLLEEFQNTSISALMFKKQPQIVETIRYSRLSRCSTARGSNTGLSLVGPTKVKACKSFPFTEGYLKVEKNLF